MGPQGTPYPITIGGVDILDPNMWQLIGWIFDERDFTWAWFDEIRKFSSF